MNPDIHTPKKILLFLKLLAKPWACLTNLCILVNDLWSDLKEIKKEVFQENSKA